MKTLKNSVLDCSTAKALAKQKCSHSHPCLGTCRGTGDTSLSSKYKTHSDTAQLGRRTGRFVVF